MTKPLKFLDEGYKDFIANKIIGFDKKSNHQEKRLDIMNQYRVVFNDSTSTKVWANNLQEAKRSCHKRIISIYKIGHTSHKETTYNEDQIEYNNLIERGIDVMCKSTTIQAS